MDGSWIDEKSGPLLGPKREREVGWRKKDGSFLIDGELVGDEVSSWYKRKTLIITTICLFWLKVYITGTNLVF